MRMLPSRYMSNAKPAQLKKVVSQLKHLQAPIKGLSLSSKMVQGDALTASILDNWIVEKDRVTVRPGFTRQLTLPVASPIETLVPHYGPDTLLLASAGSLYDMAGAAVKGGFTVYNEWSWTSFANLSQQKYTVMANGHDGVWSWDGGSVVDGAPVTASSLSNANPAVVTVPAADIGNFVTGHYVSIVGADSNHAAANGTHIIGTVNTSAHTFTLADVDLSAASGAQTSGVDAIPLGSVVKQSIAKPTGHDYVDVNKLHLVLVHMNRLWFADRQNLAIYYLPLQQMSGTLKELPMNGLFRRGGSILAMYGWTIDGGQGLDDMLAVFTTNNEVVIYRGTDPDNADLWGLVGIFRIDHPVSGKAVMNYGGDLLVFTSTGLFPMSTLIRAEADKLSTIDRDVTQMFRDLTRAVREGTAGFQLTLAYESGWAICNFPTGAPNQYRQMIRFMPDPVYASWSNVPARSWQWLDSRLWCGSDDGVLYEISREALSDDGKPILADIQLTWSAYNTAGLKHFKMISPYLLTDGLPRPYLDMKVDYDSSVPFNWPEVSLANVGATWDVATWDVDYWALGPEARNLWTGVAVLGRVGAPRLRVSIQECVFSIAGFDVLYEIGAAVG